MKIMAVRIYQTVFVTPKKSEQKHFFAEDPKNKNLKMEPHEQGVLFTSKSPDGEVDMITLVPYTNIASINYYPEEKKFTSLKSTKTK